MIEYNSVVPSLLNPPTRLPTTDGIIEGFLISWKYIEAMKLADSFRDGLFLSFNSLSFNCAVMYLNDICASEAFPAIETTR